MADPLPLPPGQYRIAIIDPTRPGRYPEAIDRRQVSIELEGWTPERIEKNRETFAGYNHMRAIVFRPMEGDGALIGFRNVEPSQVAAMKRDGFEPAWVVQVGKRFDVLLKAHARLTEDESRQLKYHLTARYQLTLPQGTLRDAVRLPGFEAERGRPESKAVLAEAKGWAFSASERVTTQLRNREEQIAIARWARAQPLSNEQQRLPISALAAGAEPRPTLPATHPVAQVQRRLAEEIRDLADGPSRELGSFAGTLERARELNREILTTLVRDRTTAAVPLASFRELARVEQDMGAFRHEQLGALAAIEGEVGYLRGEIAAADRGIFRDPSLQGFADRHSAVTEGFNAEILRRRELELGSRLPLVLADLAAERLQAAVVISPRDERVHEAFRIGAEREAGLRLDRGERIRPTPNEMPSLPDLKAMLAANVAKEGEIVTRLKDGSHGSAEDLTKLVSTWRENILHRVELERNVYGAELRATVQALPLQRDAALFTHPEPALSSLTYHLRALADWNTTAPATSARPGTPRAETEALVAVAQGDVSPRALSRLQGELMASTGERAIPQPLNPFRESDPLVLLRRFAELEREVRSWASDMSTRPDWFEGGAEHLIAKSAALIQVQQAVEKLERRHHGVAEPSPAPDGIAQATWDRAWLKRAEEKHLPQPERHLGNIGPPLAPRELAMERAVALKTVEVQAVRAVTKELERGVVLR